MFMLPSFFCPGETRDLEESSPCSPVPVWGRGNPVNVVTPFTLLMWSFLASVVQRVVSASSLCSGIFTMVSCLWIVTSSFSCAGD